MNVATKVENFVKFRVQQTDVGERNPNLKHKRDFLTDFSTTAASQSSGSLGSGERLVWRCCEQ